MQEYSERTHSILSASHQLQQRSTKHKKTQSVKQVIASRMKKAESRDIARWQKHGKAKTCPVCGSTVKGKQGCCVSCGTIIDGPAPGTNYALKPMLPIDRLLFLHLDVESGKISYIESDSQQDLFGEIDLKEGRIE
ncbi:MAG: hypothetical protein QW505_03930 [Thermoplasmata archaeon]